MAKVPKIVNVADIDRTSINFDLLHFTKVQWKKAIGGVTVSKDTSLLPAIGLILHAIPDPAGNVTVFAGCEPSPDTVCIVKNKLAPNGSIGMQCQCKPVGRPAPRPGGGLVIPAPDCSLQINGGRIECVKGACRGECRLSIVMVGRHLRLFCACV